MTSYTGLTSGDNKQLFDQDLQAQGRPDQVLGMLETNQSQHTNQFSQELRFASSWSGPLQATVGALYWKENRRLLDNNLIIDCIGVRKTSFNPVTVGFSQAGVCDGLAGTVGPARAWQTFAPAITTPANLNTMLLQYTDPATGRPYARAVPSGPYEGAPWRADTDHASAYLSLDFAMTDELKFTVEDRYVVERAYQLAPNQSSCAFLAAVNLPNPANQPGTGLNTNGGQIFCKSIYSILQHQNDTAGYPLPDPSSGNADDWALVGGAVRTKFHTPKLTINYQVTPEDLLYFSWAKAEKPAGINSLNPGGTAVTIGDLLFKPEKVYAYELGAKTAWQARGTLIANAAVFFEDYTDKQVTTSVVVNNQLQPRVLNASGAQSAGVELELQWQPEYVDGLTARLGYTYLSARYTDFKQYVRTMSRVLATQQCAPSFYLDSLTGNPTPFCQLDLSGHSLERTPKHSANGALNLQRPFMKSGWEWFSELGVQYQGRRYLDEDNFTQFDAYWMVDLRFGLTSDRWDVTGYVNNVFDDRTMKSGGSGPDWGTQLTNTLGFPSGLGVLEWFGPLPDPRVIGVRASFKFGKGH